MKITLHYSVYGKKSFLSTESDIKILQSIYFAYKVGIVSCHSNRTLQCLHAHIRWESTHIRWSRTCSIGFIFSYNIIVRVTYSGVFKGRQARHLPRAPICKCNV